MKKIAVLLANGFEEIEALTVVDVLRRANEHCDLVSIEDIDVVGGHNIKVTADTRLTNEIKEYDMIVLPGGVTGSRNLQNSSKVIDLVKYFNENNKFIAAICAAPIILKTADIIEGKNITSYPGYEDELQGANYIETEDVIVDGNIITSRGPATTLSFSFELLKILGNDSYIKLKEGMQYNFLMRDK